MAEPTTPPAPPPVVPKMITWTGEDDLHFINQVAEDGVTIERIPTSGPSFLMWNKVRFDKDKPKLIDPAQATTADERATFVHILTKLAKITTTRFTVEDVKKGSLPAEEPGEEEAEEEEAEVTHHKRGKSRR